MPLTPTPTAPPLPLSARLIEYRALLSSTLAPLVASRAAALTRLDAEVADAAAIQAELAQLAAATAEGREARLLADVGAGFRMHARLPPQRAGGGGVLMHVGLGVYPELMLGEAQARASARMEALARTRAAAAEALATVRRDLVTADAAIAALSEGASGGHTGHS